MALPPATFNKSRLFTTVISTLIWWAILYGTGVWVSGGSAVTHVMPVNMALAALICLLCVPYFATHSVLLGGLKGVLKGKIILPDNRVDAGAEPGNAWRAGAINALIFGAAPAVVGYFLASSSTTEFSARQFAVRLASAGAVIAAICVWYVAGNPLLQATRVPRGKPRFNGDAKPYLLGHFVIPHAVANLVINAALAFVLSPVPFAAGTSVVPKINVIIDTAITCVILTWIIGRGARSQALTEAEWGLAPSAAASQHSVLVAALTPMFASFGFTLVVAVALFASGAEGLNIYAWAAYRGVVFGAYSAWLARSVGQAAINSVLHPAQPAIEAKAA